MSGEDSYCTNEPRVSSESFFNKNIIIHQIIREEITLIQQDLSSRLPPASPSTSSVGLITTEIIRPYPKVDRNVPKKTKKGKLKGKSRIYTKKID